MRVLPVLLLLLLGGCGGGQYPPLAQVARVGEVLEEPILWRRSRELTLTVRADIVDHVQAPDVSMAIEPTLADINPYVTAVGAITLPTPSGIRTRGCPSTTLTGDSTGNVRSAAASARAAGPRDSRSDAVVRPRK